MKKMALIFVLLLAAVVAVDMPDGSWVMGSAVYGIGPDEMTPTLNYDDVLRLTIDSSDIGQSVFKLMTVYDTPTNASYDLEFDVRVNAPNIDLDFGMTYSGATEGTDNDGPNLFAFAYDYNESEINNLPLPISTLSWYDKFGTMCHAHMECNFVAALDIAYDFYCRSPGTTYQYAGWVYDAHKFGNTVKVNNVNAEAFPDNGWKTVRLNMDQGECVGPKTTILIMGVDAIRDRPYTWEIKNVKLVTSETIPLPLNHVYRYDKATSNYTRVAKPQFCGDGETEGTEECDGDDGLEMGWECNSQCKLVTKCGDNLKVGDEVCDGSFHAAGFTCASNCTMEIPVCGDNLLVADEVCDGTTTPAGFQCGADCLTMSPICGDNVMVGTEECDGANSTEAGFACTDICTLYRELSEKEQEGIDSMIELVKSSEVGVPSNAKFTIPRGTYSSKDFADQFILDDTELAGNVSFCVPGTLACEAEYILIEDAMATATGMSPVDDLKGIAKVYKSEVNGSVMYYVGFKGGTGLLPYIEMDTTMWIAVGVIGLLTLGAGVVLLLILGGFVFYTKKGGINIKKIFK